MEHREIDDGWNHYHYISNRRLDLSIPNESKKITYLLAVRQIDSEYQSVRPAQQMSSFIYLYPISPHFINNFGAIGQKNLNTPKINSVF